MSQFSSGENKGQYCQFMQTADGTYILKPVKVPAHVKAERAERIRRREIHRHVQKNRRRSQAITGGSLLFMTAAISFFVIVCCLFLSLQNQVNERMDSIASLQSQIEQMTEDNDAVEKRLVSSQNLSAIEAVASQKLGMRSAQPDQIIYYTNARSDYMLQYADVSDDK